MAAPDEAFVFNVVWTGTVFTYLRYFVVSQIANSAARYRFIGNGCPPDQLDLMEKFAARRPERVVEVLETSSTMVNHGVALDSALTMRDDGEFFCFVDPDILARGPYLSAFSEALDACDAVSSGRGVWRDDDVLPDGHPGVSGEYFYSPDGYLFGSPHFAMYRRRPLLATMGRWDVTFASGGNELSTETRPRLREAGQEYWIYDTGKVVNILFQEDGNVFCHFEHPALMHIGGLSHYLAPTRMVTRGGKAEPDWKTWRAMETRFEVAHFTASVVCALADGHRAPQIPPGIDPDLRTKLVIVRDALIELVERYGDQVD